ncbi:hypothetical protein ACHAWX_007113 [Stephanocyclus meneghinianus]
MKHESKPCPTTASKVPTPLDPTLDVLQLNETTCAVNEASTPVTETECLSENHELELDDFAQFIASSWDEDMINSEEKTPITVLNRMTSFASCAFLQPKQDNGLMSISNDSNKKNAKELDHTLSSLDSMSMNLRSSFNAADHGTEDHDIAGQENIEIPYDYFVTAVTEESTAENLDPETHNDAAGERALGEEEARKVKKQLQYRQVQVSIKIKELKGITRICSRKKINFFSASSNDLVSGENNTVAAIVTYRDELIDGNEHAIMHSISLPLSCESDSTFKKISQTKAYARWEDEEPYGCDFGRSESEQTSGISFRRTLTRPLVVDDDVETNAAASDETAAVGIHEDGLENDLEIGSLVALQVGLESHDDSTPLGVATVIIPWEYQSVEMDIPIMTHSKNVAIKKRKLFALGSSTRVSFPSDALAKYIIDEGASLSIRLVISPEESKSDQHLLPDVGTNDSQAGKTKPDTQLSQQEETDPEQMVQCSSWSSASSSKMSDEPFGMHNSVADYEENIPTCNSLGGFNYETKTDEKKTLSVITDTSSVPLFKIIVQKEDEIHLSEISESDSSSRSIVRSRHTEFRASHHKALNVAERVIEFLTCHPTPFFDRNHSTGEKGEESSDMSSSSSSSGSTSLSSSVYEERDVKLDFDVDLDVDEPVFKRPDHSPAG